MDWFLYDNGLRLERVKQKVLASIVLFKLFLLNLIVICLHPIEITNNVSRFDRQQN